MKHVLSVLLLLVVLGGCHKLPTYRYRLSVEVMTPTGIKSSSSVIEVKNWTEFDLNGGGQHWLSECRGEGVAVDLDGRRQLFVLPEGANRDRGWPCQVMYFLVWPPAAAEGDDEWGPTIREAMRRRAPIRLPERYVGWARGRIPALPLMVTFRDLGQPNTIEVVDPADLERSFGPGFKLKQVSVQMTEDPVTDRLARQLPWWHQYTERFFDGKPIRGTQRIDPEDPSSYLSSGSFKVSKY